MPRCFLHALGFFTTDLMSEKPKGSINALIINDAALIGGLADVIYLQCLSPHDGGGH